MKRDEGGNAKTIKESLFRQQQEDGLKKIKEGTYEADTAGSRKDK